MKHVFVLDENVLIQSHNCKSIKDSSDDYDSLSLVLQMARKCHKIGLSEKLTAKYREWLKKLEKERTSIIPIRVWKHFLYNNGKHVLCNNRVKDLPADLEHDRHVIEPALFLKAPLITTDGKLKERLKPWLQGKHLTIDIKSPKDAEDFLSKSDLQGSATKT